jgi:hypothetical protein
MMKAIERRIVWNGRQRCDAVFNDAEAHMEGAVPRDRVRLRPFC